MLKNLKKIILWSALILISTASLKAQLEEETYYFGVKSGFTLSNISGVKNTLISSVYSCMDCFESNTKFRPGVQFGIFFQHRPVRSFVAVQVDFNYAIHSFHLPNRNVFRMGGDFNYSDINDLNYKTQFNYHYVNISPTLKVYPFGSAFDGFKGGVNFLTGIQLGFNVAPTNLFYKSNDPNPSVSLQIQENLRSILKGQTDFSIIFGLGFEVNFGSKSGLTIENRFKLGLSDAISTLSNGFDLIESHNRRSSFELSIGWAIPFTE